MESALLLGLSLLLFVDRLLGKVLGDGGRDEGMVAVVVVSSLVGLGDEVRLVEDAELVDTVEAVLGRVVCRGGEVNSRSGRDWREEQRTVLLTLENGALVPGKVTRMDGDTVIVLLTSSANALRRGKGSAFSSAETALSRRLLTTQ